MSLKKITENKRDFSIEKIASAIHAENLISSLKNKYIDPLILYRRKKAKRKQRNLSEPSNNDDSFSLNKILVYSLLKPKNDEDKLDFNITKTILPIITPVNNEEKKSDKLLVTSGMFKQKEFLKNDFQKIKLGNVMNFKNKGDSIYQSLYPKIENLKKINDKYNLNLDLKFYQEEKPKIKNNKIKSVAQKNLMNYLFKKFIMNSDQNNNIESEESSKNNENIINPTANDLFKLKESEIKKKKSFTIDEIIQKKNINKNLLKDEDKYSKNAFITRIPLKKNIIEEPKENLKTTNILKPRKRVFSYSFDQNNNIIKHDQKVFVDCLYSEIISNLDKNKIIYNPIGKVKTNYAITKEPSYKKIKKFETMIDNIIKTPQNLSITASQ
jgi:hypothetical protein